MKASRASVVVAVLALVAAATADDRSDRSKLIRPLYPYGVFPGLLSKPNVKAELKVTSAQEPAIEASLKKWRDGFVHEVEHGKPIDFYAIEQKNFDGMMDLLGKSLDAQQMKRLKQLILQSAGMELFEHQEIRDALHLNDGQVANLKKVHGQLLHEISGGGKGKYSKEEVKKLFGALMKGVPEKVRAALNEDQRQKLQELIGDQFSFQ